MPSQILPASSQPEYSSASRHRTCTAVQQLCRHGGRLCGGTLGAGRAAADCEEGRQPAPPAASAPSRCCASRALRATPARANGRRRRARHLVVCKGEAHVTRRVDEAICAEEFGGAMIAVGVHPLLGRLQCLGWRASRTRPARCRRRLPSRRRQPARGSCCAAPARWSG